MKILEDLLERLNGQNETLVEDELDEETFDYIIKDITGQSKAKLYIDNKVKECAVARKNWRNQ